MMVLSFVFVTYVVAAIIAQPNWNLALMHTVIPEVSSDFSFLSAHGCHGRHHHRSLDDVLRTEQRRVEKGVTVKDLFFQRIDAITGAVVACIIAWFIIVTTGAVLFPQGIEIESAADAAMALAPFAGPYAEALFAIGLVAASLLAACALPSPPRWSCAEAFGWEAGVNFTWKEAPLFKGIFTFTIVGSALVILVPGLNLMGIMLTAQFVNGVILPVLSRVHGHHRYRQACDEGTHHRPDRARAASRRNDRGGGHLSRLFALPCRFLAWPNRCTERQRRFLLGQKPFSRYSVEASKALL